MGLFSSLFGKKKKRKPSKETIYRRAQKRASDRLFEEKMGLSHKAAKRLIKKTGKKFKKK